ncbi:MAG: 30S ribosomal protein S19 [Nanoarchaeota archaeon]|nr:30S ribosomal protein S19 [Nanoarchaeota archaeon]|tara:strand:- start:1168 stop:1551 length:384 start_codon:yes stop_codon:yes gene_type:complete
MVVGEFKFYGKSVEELKTMSLKEFMELIPARQRRSIKRGFSEEKKKLLENIKKSEKPVKTHLRDIIVVPDMLGKRILVHNGKSFVDVTIDEEMLGRYLGEFVMTRQRVQHSAPGIGATKSSAAVSVR